MYKHCSMLFLLALFFVCIGTCSYRLFSLLCGLIDIIIIMHATNSSTTLGIAYITRMYRGMYY